jgi:hypothetical protein
VAHLTDGTLRRMFDDPDAKVGADASHLESCAECQARFNYIAGDARSIATLLAVAEPRVDVAKAFARVSAAPKSQPPLGLRFPVLRPAGRPALAMVAAVAAAAVVVVAFAFSGLFFKPTTVQAVPVTVADVQALSQLSAYGNLTWTKQPDLHVVTNATDASAAAAGMQAPAVSSLPKGVSKTLTYAAMPQAQAVFTFSADKAAAAAQSHGKSLPKLPAGMDGATLTITVGPAIGEIYGNLNQPNGASSSDEINLPQLVIAKSAAPTATSSQVTVKQLEDYILAQPGISDQLKNAIKAIGDPSTTLLIPVPIEYATSTHVTVQGVDGVALGDNTGVGSGIVWVKSGFVYVVAGSIKQSDALNIANNLK